MDGEGTSEYAPENSGGVHCSIQGAGKGAHFGRVFNKQLYKAIDPYKSHIGPWDRLYQEVKAHNYNGCQLGPDNSRKQNRRRMRILVEPYPMRINYLTPLPLSRISLFVRITALHIRPPSQSILPKRHPNINGP